MVSHTYTSIIHSASVHVIIIAYLFVLVTKLTVYCIILETVAILYTTIRITRWTYDLMKKTFRRLSPDDENGNRNGKAGRNLSVP